MISVCQFGYPPEESGGNLRGQFCLPIVGPKDQIRVVRPAQQVPVPVEPSHWPKLPCFPHPLI